jgi:hypothetical protein
VAILEADWDGTAPVPVVSLVTVAITAPRVVAMPTPAGALGLSLNSPVELFFSGTERTTYYMSIDGVGGIPVEIVLDGAGRVFVSDPERGLFLDATGNPPAGSPAPLAVFDGITGGVLTRAPVSPPRPKLLFAVTNVGVGPGGIGHGRFSVNRVPDIFPLSVWFKTLPGSATYQGQNLASLTARMTTIINETSKVLYQATVGRSRIGGLSVALGPPAGPLTPAGPFDVIVSPAPAPAPHTIGAQDLPIRSIDVDTNWFALSAPLAGWHLAHEIFHYRYLLPDEYLPDPSSACSGCQCPPSIMGGKLEDELCWTGNHNPSNNPFLTNLTLPRGINVNMWALYAVHVPVTAPMMTPQRILRGSSSGAISSSVIFP